MTQLPDRQALRRLAAGLCIVSWLMFVPAMAADAQQTDAASSESPATALVELDGRPILRVRGVAGLSAVDRARVIKDRIIEFARDRDVPVGTLSLEESPLGTAIVAGGKPLLVVSDADSALEEMDRQTLARVTREILVERVKTWRAERAPEVRWRNAALAAAATLLLGVFLWIVSRVTRRLREYVRTRIASRVRSVGVQSFEFVKARHLQALAQSAPGFAFWVVVVAAIYTYLDFVLKLFPATRVLGEGLFSLVTDPLQTLGLGFLDQLPNLIFLVVLAFVVRYLLKLMRLYFEAIGRGALRFENFDAEWSLPTYKVLRLFVVILALVVAYPYIPGSDSAAFKGISVMLGVLFSLGSSSVIANVIAGYTMTYRRAFRTGDRIKVGEVMGEVVDSRIQVTMLRTPKNEMVVVPNSEILNTSLINYSTLAKTQGLVLHTTVGIGYETPWRQVEAMLLMAAARTEGLLREPPPFVLQKSLGDFCVVYEINAYIDSAARMPQLYSALHSNILDVFNEYGVQIMTPAYEGDTPDPKLVRPGDWYAAPARPPEAGTSVEKEGV
jgi:small-conductance mechanosensitive channel